MKVYRTFNQIVDTPPAPGEVYVFAVPYNPVRHEPSVEQHGREAGIIATCRDEPTAVKLGEIVAEWVKQHGGMF